ncbi:hypothetical protein Clacol_009164 [Clathrus columnatus]|uniref:methionyl-tRNA formyltransferase n=1 Tax=Clathrus columnatus TaxID=1419009 RepID=A0AAV5AJS9_9AGAM|nr:hypothetical protein Clacol_009164 [Clathrus columnatus]
MDAASPPLDLILMPGLAFDKALSRLGHGKGYYDRFISTYSIALSQSQKNCGPTKMPALYALSLTEQILPLSALPTADHDWPLDDLWNECWVVTNPDAKIGRRGKTISPSPLKVLAQALKLPNATVPPKDIGLRNWEVPLPFQNETSGPNVLVTASFGRIIPASILRLFRKEHRLNVHPSLLPLYRGPAPIQHAIADGASTTGVTISTINPFKYGVDAGDIWNAQTMEIPLNTTFDTFSQTLADVGGKLLLDTLRSMSTGTARSIKQNDSKATSAPFVKRDFMEIDWNSWDACKLDRRHRAASHQYALRALLPYGPTLQLQQLSIHLGSQHKKLSEPGDAIFDLTSQSIIIQCANKTQVSVTHLQQENKRVLSALDFWNGIRPEGLHNGILKLGSILGK